MFILIFVVILISTAIKIAIDTCMVKFNLL